MGCECFVTQSDGLSLVENPPKNASLYATSKPHPIISTFFSGKYNTMTTFSWFGKLLVISVFNVLAMNMVHSQMPTGQTEITKWQYGKKGAVSITYDDGTINQFRVAVPIMNRLGLPGTFYINTGLLPDSKYPGRFIGRPVQEIIEETKTIPTHADNVYERASAARYLGFQDTDDDFTNAGTQIDSGRPHEAYGILDELYRKVVDGELRPVRPENGRVDTENVLTWDMVKTHAAEGHEFASHLVTHPRACALDDANLQYELEKSREEILNRIGIRHTFSAELPYGTQNDRALQAALKVYPATRNRIAEDFVLELHRPNRRTPVSPDDEYVFWERGLLTATTLAQMNEWVDITASQDNIWLVTVIHGIDGIGWEPLTSQTIDDHFSYIQSKENDLWVATFSDAARYIKQRMRAKVSFSLEGENILVTLTHPLDKELYDLPLTLKTYVDHQWTEVCVRQGESVAQVPVRREGAVSFVMYQAMPGDETIKISQIK
jgi:peptidoglycan/xylan/chitin deacetylase (PgdA/CDA1 family)